MSSLIQAAAGWRMRWQATTSQPNSPGSAILNNDFKIDNCQFDPDDPDRVISVFDWDIATAGAPLVDVGILLNYRPDPSDTDDNRPMRPAAQECMDLPTRAEIVKRYSEITDADMSAIAWYEAFGCWKTAIVVAQLYNRYCGARLTTSDKQGSPRLTAYPPCPHNLGQRMTAGTILLAGLTALVTGGLVALDGSSPRAAPESAPSSWLGAL
jgi:aminoglycoside phosphotransferase (APT) family kinase protein